jgi:tetratricopeptide (TPR) repeat protein
MTSSSAPEGNRAPDSFVGRKRELAELRAGLRDAIAGHSHLFLLNGEPGIGKTSLTDEFGREALVQGVRVAWGRCWEGDGAPAYWPWIQVLRACLGDSDAEHRAAILNSEASPQVGQDVAQLLPELRAAHAPTPRHLRPQPTDPEQARFQLFESVATVLKNVARVGSLVIVIDDLHDADRPTLLLLKFIAGHIKNTHILLVGTYRDTEVRQSLELTRLIGDLSREGHSLPMVGLSELEVGEFVANSSGRKADGRLVADLYQATDGNPLFVDGVVRLLVAEGRLDRAAAGDTFKIPDGVQESIRRRLLKLPEETNRMLSIASVIGNEFETQLLTQASGSASEEIVERLEGALRAGIVVDSPIGGPHYRFSHPLVREALYQDLPARRRIQLHAVIGAAIEEVHKDDLKPRLAALAHHFRAAGNADSAINYSIAASDAAEAMFAHEEALSHLRTALAIPECHDHDAAQRAAVLLRLGRILACSEDREQGLAYLDRALRIFEQIGDDQRAGEAHFHLGRMFVFGPQMHVKRALSNFQRAEILLRRDSESYSLGMLHWGLALVSFEALRINEALTSSQKAMDTFARLGDRESWASVAGNHSQYLMVKGKLAEAKDLLDQIAGVAASFANPNAFQTVNWMCGWFWLQMRDPKKAFDYYRLALKRPGNDINLQKGLFEFLAICEAVVGNLTEARRLATDNCINPASPFLIRYYDGEWKAAEEGLEKALDWARSIGAKWEELNALSLGVDIRRVTGDYAGAAAAFERALSLYQPDDLFWEARLRPQGVMLYFDAEYPQKAAEQLEVCHRVLATQGDWLGRIGPILRAEAIVASLRDCDDSDHYFQKSIEIFNQYSFPWDEAETLHYWGKVLLKAGQPQRALEKLNAATKIYRDHGSGQAWIDRVEADRRRAGPPCAKVHLQSGRAEAKAATRDAVFRNEGDFWTISYVDRRFRLRDMRGLHYIAYLLGHPCERFHVRELSAIAGSDAFSAATSSPGIHVERENAPPILDSKAKADYRARLSELHADLDEAERMNDTGRAERTRRELDFVNDELSVAVGLSGRDRKVSDAAERARKRIGKAIRSALTGIREYDPSLAHHLTTCIRTGYYCAYLSDPQQPVSWKL